MAGNDSPPHQHDPQSAGPVANRSVGIDVPATADVEHHPNGQVLERCLKEIQHPSQSALTLERVKQAQKVHDVAKGIV